MPAHRRPGIGGSACHPAARRAATVTSYLPERNLGRKTLQERGKSEKTCVRNFALPPPVFSRTMIPERPGFRSDIEGLRGIAILLVIPFHAGVSWLAGGFVAV